MTTQTETQLEIGRRYSVGMFPSTYRYAGIEKNVMSELVHHFVDVNNPRRKSRGGVKCIEIPVDYLKVENNAVTSKGAYILGWHKANESILTKILQEGSR